ncbi:MAG: zinc ABC transporter substrate-binding protein [Muribaculum sp.]|nr:zinc ABC transporter substrate-binding protein [Muribaculum sp.]
MTRAFIHLLTKRHMSLLAILATLICFVSCSTRPVTDKPTITVSIRPQKYFLEKIVGDKWDVKCLLGNSADPESFDPGMTHLINLENSKAYFRIGNIPFESAIINKVKNNNPGLLLYDNSEGISLITGTHSQGGSEIDPHTWTSIKNAKKIASNMYDAVAELDPTNKRYYGANLKKFLHELDSLDTCVDSLLRPMRGSAFVVWHPSLSYFARDYGLHQICLSPEGKEASVNMIKKSVEQAKKENAKILFYQKDVDSRQAVSINEQLGANLVEIQPLSYEWYTEMSNIANAIANQTNN